VKALVCGAVALRVSSYVMVIVLPLLEVCGVPGTGGDPSTRKRSELDIATWVKDAELSAASVIDPLLRAKVLAESEIPSLSTSPLVTTYVKVSEVVPLPPE
jgi:hypothetical protein